MELPDTSTTPTEGTPRTDEAAPAAVSEEKQQAEKTEKRRAKAAESPDLDVFDGPPNDPAGARGREPAAEKGPPAGKKGGARRGKGGKTPAEEKSPEELAALKEAKKGEARGILLTLSAMQRGVVRRQYQELIPPQELDPLLEQLKPTEEELESLADPLAEGLAEEGISLPWYARLALAAVPALVRQAGINSQLKGTAEKGAPVVETKWNAEKNAYEAKP